MKKDKKQLLDFEVDILTNSILNSITGDSLRTKVTLLQKQDLKIVIKKNGWKFDWKSEFKKIDRQVFKLTIEENSSIIQGLVSFTVFENYIEMHLIENAPFNFGKNKAYDGVAGNLVAFVCKTSFERGGKGYVSFIAKTRLIEHYKNILGAENPHGHQMVINSKAANILIKKYFKN